MNRARKKLPSQIEAVDLFCGVGGLTHGLKRGGVNVRAGIDLDQACKYPYEANNDAKFIKADVAKVAPTDIRACFSEQSVSLLAGCAPCQPFSTYSRSGRQENGDWALLRRFGALVREVQPDLVTMENVPALQDHKVFREFIRDLKGYSVFWRVIDCADIGVPQTRKRLVLLASKFGPEGLSLDWKKRKKTVVKDAIADLPALSAGDVWSDDPLHSACRLSALNLKRIKASMPGGTWRDWPLELRAACHRRDSGATYPSVYGRMEWDKPSPTITTQCFGYGNGRFGHPSQDRAISLREAAILQTFPKRYKFVADHEKVRTAQLGRLIGNAVPVKLGEAIGRALVNHVRICEQGKTAKFR